MLLVNWDMWKIWEVELPMCMA